MLQSQLFTRTSKTAPKEEEAINAILLTRAGFVDKLMSGVYTFLPLGLRVIHRISQIIREEMNAVGGQEVSMPVLHPKKNWEQTDRWNSVDILFKFTSYYTKTDLVLGPTHEEVVTPLLKKFILSYKDLPRAVFQIQNKFRDELRAKSGLMRGREFLMKDMYSFHASEADLDEYYEKAKIAYETIFKRVGLGKQTVLTYASGGTFSKYSHEYQTIVETGEDNVFLCQKCNIAVNKEIIADQSTCPQCGNKDLKPVKAAEVGNIFKLGTKFSKPFEFQYKDQSGSLQDIWMGCYGIGISRLMGVVVEAFHDDKGMIWPESIAPYQIHLICLDDTSKTKSDILYQELQKNQIEVLYDDRMDKTPGEKLADADLIGIPYRVILSERTGDNIEIKKRSESDIKLISKKELFVQMGK
ncbi:MAG: Prolyl-tRNA synthetase [Parcubacteria group bacterium GW2011_GWB1_46_8]|nr:MAG: hypothetical protein UV67_C0029G0004 [Parcubacteria group bacterium GW2011_GWC1_43_12]KKU09860.1 MAG: Prolyl-tRNA synthetase [Parcubacteria group bacterium GW2011_GWF1_45_5]KKU46037.1 MAG: Prolyl-tRNA synthetase [Parcubacteria group bacterium GW2011_GWB1_46_8]KKU47314.1 MAG: Prolyl-tRNA synthetase [Parcubacteria group bacterium GW2011_GWF2_46_8]